MSDIIAPRFNPCFVGSSSQAPFIIHTLSPLISVSILVLLEVPLRLEELIQEKRVEKFVSILVLLEVPLRHILRHIVMPDIPSFNPCFVGSSSQAERRQRRRSPEACFNPCFVGSSSQAKQMGNRRGRETLFQSLFCWKFLLGARWNDGFRLEDLFQSLFCWKFLLGQYVDHIKEAVKFSFNPCFVGSSSQACPNGERGPVSSLVSILVLLEVPLRQQFLSLCIYYQRLSHFHKPVLSRIFCL